MGSIKGQAHTKVRKRLTDEERSRLVARNEEVLSQGLKVTQAQLGEEFGVTQAAVSKILREEGSRTRTRSEANMSSFNIHEASRIYNENPRMRLEDVGDLFDVTWSAVQWQFKKHGIQCRKRSDYPTYTGCNRNFFSEVNPTSAYFAGFIAADGYITKSGNSVNFGIHPKDVRVLESLKKAATLDQPIVTRPNNSGRPYCWLSVCSAQWVKDLERHYNIVTKEVDDTEVAQHLRPVTCVALPTRLLRWRRTLERPWNCDDLLHRIIAIHGVDPQHGRSSIERLYPLLHA